MPDSIVPSPFGGPADASTSAPFSLSADAEHAALLICRAGYIRGVSDALICITLEASQSPSVAPCNAGITNDRDPAEAAVPARRLYVRSGGAVTVARTANLGAKRTSRSRAQRITTTRPNRQLSPFAFAAAPPRYGAGRGCAAPSPPGRAARVRPWGGDRELASRPRCAPSSRARQCLSELPDPAYYES